MLAWQPNSGPNCQAEFDQQTGSVVFVAESDLLDASRDRVPVTWTWDGNSVPNLSPKQSPIHRPYFEYQEPGRVVSWGFDTNDFSSSTHGVAHEWAWNGSQWEEGGAIAAPTSPLVYAFDEVAGKVTGFSVNPCGKANPSQTLAWDGTEWTVLTSTRNPPTRDQTYLVYDGALRGILLWGGATYDCVVPGP